MSNIKELDDYIIQTTIGKGTFGKVNLGIHKLTNEAVAIKILEKSKIKTEENLKRINEEINNLKEINNINIVQLYEILEDKNNYYLIFEYISGGELFSYIINEERLNEQQSSFFLYQIINAVNEIHKKNICHRDIKPENILLDEKKQFLKLIDFGLSKKYSGYLSTPCGSPSYVAPEMIKGLIYDSLFVDIWSCGILLYGMIFGFLPFDDQNNEILFSKILNNNIEFPNNIIISNECRDLIIKMLEKEPNKRICINDILNHPFLNYGKEKFNEIIQKYNEYDDSIIVNYMENNLGFNNNNNNIIKNIKNNKHNNITTTFKLIKKQILNGHFNYNTKKSIIKKNKGSKVIGIKYEQKNFPNLTTSLTSSGNSIINELNDVIIDSNEMKKNNNVIINNLNMKFVSHSIDGNDFKKNKAQFIDLINKNIDKNLIKNKIRPKTGSLEKDIEKINNISNKITNYYSKGNNTKINFSYKKMKYRKLKTENKNLNNNCTNYSIVFKSNINLNPKLKEKMYIKTISHTSRQKSNENKNNNINLSNRLCTSKLLNNRNIDKNNSKDKSEEKITLTQTDIENNNNYKKPLNKTINFKTLNEISTKTQKNRLSLVNKKRINTYVIKNVISKDLKKSNIIKNKSPNSLKNKFTLTTENSSQDKNNRTSLPLKNKDSNIQSRIRSKKKENIKRNLLKVKSKTPNKYSPEKNINSKFETGFTICSTQHSLIELCIGLKKFCKTRHFILMDKDKIKYTIYLLDNKKININITNKNGINMVKLTREKEEYVENIIKQIIIDVIL